VVWRVHGSNSGRVRDFTYPEPSKETLGPNRLLFSMDRVVLSGFKMPGNEVYHSPVCTAETENGKLDLHALSHMPSRRGYTFTFTVFKNVVCYFKPLDT